MPNYMMDEILEGLDTLSISELIEIKMHIGLNNYNNSFNSVLSELINTFLLKLF